MVAHGYVAFLLKAAVDGPAMTGEALGDVGEQVRRCEGGGGGGRGVGGEVGGWVLGRGEHEEGCVR